MKILCVIPVFNEHHRLNDLIDQLKKNEYKKYNLKYLFINNGSKDKSLDLIQQSGLSYLNLKQNKGVGYALMLGFLYAKKNNFNFIVHLAGNGKMKPSEIKNFINKSSDFDFISGSRFLYGSSKKNNPFYRIILIKIFNLILKLFFKVKITDSTCGFRMFNVNIYKDFKNIFFKKELFTYGYEYFSYGKIIKSKKIKITEVPVSMDYPSKKNYTKIRPILDWYIIAKFWLKGLTDEKKL